MNNRKTEAARAEIRAVLEPIKQTMLTEVGKVQAEIRGSTEAVGAMRHHQAEQHALLNSLLEMVQQLEARVASLERKAIGESVH